MTDLQAAAAIIGFLSFVVIGLGLMIMFQAHRARKRLAADMRAYREAADRAERPSSLRSMGGP